MVYLGAFFRQQDGAESHLLKAPALLSYHKEGREPGTPFARNYYNISIWLKSTPFSTRYSTLFPLIHTTESVPKAQERTFYTLPVLSL